MNDAPSPVYEFGGFRLDALKRVLAGSADGRHGPPNGHELRHGKLIEVN